MDDQYPAGDHAEYTPFHFSRYAEAVRFFEVQQAESHVTNVLLTLTYRYHAK